MIKRCIGCGEIIQTEDENKPGFAASEENDYCKRCFRMMHYNELPKVLATNDDYVKVIDHVLCQNGLYILVVDIFNFYITFNETMINKLRGKDVIVVINKYDLLPHSFNVNDVLNFVSKECEKLFFKVIAIHILSSLKGYYLDDFMNTCDMFRRGRNVYILGVANVGKSTFINALLKRNTSRTKDVIATSIIPGTTLDEIIIPFFEDNKAFIDTPGLINEKDILNHVDNKYYLDIVPKGEIRPITYQVFGSYSFFLGGLGYITFEDAKDVSAVFYTSRNVNIFRVKNEKLDHALTNRIGNDLVPCSLTKKFITEEVKCQNKTNIFFSGFGFVTINGNIKVKVSYIEGTGIKVYGNILQKANRNSR